MRSKTPISNPRYDLQRVSSIRPGGGRRWRCDVASTQQYAPRQHNVDATNYVILETGQPSTFDAGKVEGGIVVRRAPQ